jgi:hypothetical protein
MKLMYQFLFLPKHYMIRPQKRCRERGEQIIIFVAGKFIAVQ